ncbi:hypothetical protein [Candidatus Uabimicrobium amorphum]|uniref:Uncharacterized protein n=1 Tax=Uabimicrobium amorphum TaxID=2596890 RepID=A0A5S9F4W2_UABAM|nr:hypothetical protein [Candidatus Uabimicrobium amorphum]BBM84904.1 hypothetical protein UABAM_03265 [Candidatus Uabimicrobium amorphum]
MINKWKRFVVLLLVAGFLSAQEAKREKYIYVPYQDWQQVWQGKKKVKLSEDQYRKLLEQQTHKAIPSQELVVRNATYRGRIHGNTLIFDMRVEIESFVNHRTFCDFTFGEYGLTQAKLNGKDAPLFLQKIVSSGLEYDNDNFNNMPNDMLNNDVQQIDEVPSTKSSRWQYRLLIPGKGSHVFTVTCHSNMHSKRDILSTNVVLGNFPQQTFYLQTLAENTYETDPIHDLDEQQQNLTIYPQKNQDIHLVVKPKEKRDEKQALLLVDIASSHLIKLDAIKSRFVINLHVKHRKLKTFQFLIPKSLYLLNISENRWDIEETNDGKILTVQLEKELLGEHRIFINAETQLLEHGDFVLPKIVASGNRLFRQTGLVYIENNRDVKLELVDAKQTRQLDQHTTASNYSNKKSKSRKRGNIHSFGEVAFMTMKIWNENYLVELRKSVIEQVVESDVAIGVSLYPDGLELVGHVNFTVVEGEAKQLSVQLPKGWLLTNLETFISKYQGRFLPTSSDNYYIKEDILHIPLKNKLRKGQVFKASVTLQNLKRMDKWEGKRYIDLPLVIPQNVKFLPSFLGIIAHQDYKITARDFSDLSSVDLKIIRSVNIDSKNLKQGYIIKTAAAKGVIEVEQKKPQTSVLATHYISIQPEKITYATTLIYSVKSASRSSFRFAMPKSFEGILNISDDRKQSLIKEKRSYVEGENRVWQVNVQKKILGNYCLYLTYELPIAQKDKTYKFYPILFSDVDYIKGFIGIQKNSRLEVEKSLKNLEEVPASQIPIFPHPKFVSTTDFSYVAKYTKEDYQLSLRVGVHDKADTVPAVLENVVIRSIFPGNNSERVECIYNLKHLGEQFFNVQLPEKANFWAVVVDGKGERPLRSKNTIAIPIPPNSGRAIRIRVMYERPAPPLERQGKIKLTRPQTSAQIPVLSLKWEVHLPEEYQMAAGIRNRLVLDVPWYVHSERILKRIYDSSRYLFEDLSLSSPKTSRSYDARPQEMPQSQSSGRYNQPKKPRQDFYRNRREMERKKYEQRRYQKLQEKKRSIQQEFEKELAQEEQMNSAGEGADFDDFVDMNSDVDEIVPQNEVNERDQRLGKSYTKNDKLKDANFWKNNKLVNKNKAIGNIVGKRGLKNVSNVETLKAKGLRSMDIELDTHETVVGRKTTAATTRSLDVKYSKASTFRSLIIGLVIASMALCLMLIAQHKLPRLPIILTLLLCATFAPMWFGKWLIPYCNAVVLGLVISIGLYISGGIMRLLLKITQKVGGWFGFQAALVLLCLFVTSNVNYAQEDVRHIYVPYSPTEMSQINSKKDIFLSYAEYTELWNKVHPQQEENLREKLPHFVLYNAKYSGKIVENQVVFSASMNVEVFKGPVNVEIGLMDASVTSASLESALRKNDLALDVHDKGYRFTVVEKGVYTLRLEFIPSFEMAQKRGKFRINLAEVPTTQVEFFLDKDMEADLQGFSGSWYEKLQAQHKVITMFPQNQSSLEMLWYESSERYRAKGLNISATSEHELLIGDNVLRLNSDITYKVASGKCEQLSMKFPQNYEIVGFSCTNLESWILTKELGYNLVKVRLANNQYRQLRVVIVAEKKLASVAGKHSFPEVEPLGVNRENGEAIVTYQDPYKVLVTNQSQVRKVNSSFSRGKFSESFRYNQHPFSLEFSIMKDKFDNTTKSNTVVSIEKDKAAVELYTNIEVKGKQIFYYNLLLAKHWRVNKVQQGKGYKGNVTNWRIMPFDKERNLLQINFYRSVKKDGRMPLYLQLDAEYDNKQPFTLPVFQGQNVSFESGTITVMSSEDLELRTSEVFGLQQIDTSSISLRKRDMVKRFAYRYQDTTYRGKIFVELRKAEVSAKTVINLLVEDDWINFGYFLRFAIKYAGVDTFHFRLPKAIGQHVDVLGENIREKRIVEADGYLSVTITLHNKVKGAYELSIFPNIAKNNGTGIVFYPMLLPPNIQNQSNIVVQNQSQYEITEQKMQGITPTSIHQVAFLPPDTTKVDFIRAYKVNSDEWELVFSENKQKIEHSIHAVIDAIKIDTVVQAPKDCYHRMIFNLRHSGLQFLELELEKEAKIRIWGAFVANRFVRPSQKRIQGKNIILIPLYQTGHKERKIAVRIIYDEEIATLAHKTTLLFNPPKVRNIEQINQVFWTLRAPREFLYRFGGNVSKVSKFKFEQYEDVSRATTSISALENEGNIYKALANSNAIQKRQNDWFQKQQQKQNAFFSNLEDIDRIKQYGTLNLQAAQRVRRGSNKKVIQDRKSSAVAGKKQSSFVQDQNDALGLLVQKQQEEKRKQLAVSFNFDIKTPDNLHKAYFTKKQGNAKLEVRCYRQPREDKMWIIVQFCGLLFLIMLASACRIFSRRNYSFRKFVLTIVIACSAVLLCIFPEYIHYFYM